MELTAKEKAAFVKDAVEDLYAALDADLHPDARTAEVKATLETHLTQFAIAVWGWKP
jgi:hypothetical protein